MNRLHPWPDASDLRAVAALEAPVVSLFVPVTAAVPEVRQNAVRHRRVVDTALERLRELGVDDPLIERARERLEDFASESSAPSARTQARVAFWSAADGADAAPRCFGLPFPVEEQVRVARCAALRTLARASSLQRRYRVLRLSANRVELLEGDAEVLEPLKAPGLPASLEDALGSQLDEPSLQMHSSDRGGDQPIYHGHGGAPRARSVDLQRFHQHVARGLEAETGSDPLPLVLAADASHRPGLEQALRRDVGLLADVLEGNADRASPGELHERSWPLVESHIRSEREAQRGGDAPKLTQISEIARHAVMGRIARLQLPAHGRIPGRLDRSTGSAAEAWGDDDLIESLAVEVVRRGGALDVAEGEVFPSDEGLAAQLR